jgi:hypothetical protein
MSDYLVSRTFSLKQQVTSRPDGHAIIALQQEITRLEKELPRPQAVPAYQPKPQTAAQARSVTRNGR